MLKKYVNQFWNILIYKDMIFLNMKYRRNILKSNYKMKPNNIHFSNNRIKTKRRCHADISFFYILLIASSRSAISR